MSPLIRGCGFRSVFGRPATRASHINTAPKTKKKTFVHTKPGSTTEANMMGSSLTCVLNLNSCHAQVYNPKICVAV